VIAQLWASFVPVFTEAAIVPVQISRLRAEPLSSVTPVTSVVLATGVATTTTFVLRAVIPAGLAVLRPSVHVVEAEELTVTVELTYAIVVVEPIDPEPSCQGPLTFPVSTVGLYV
jgi:hypothetical protein